MTKTKTALAKLRKRTVRKHKLADGHSIMNNLEDMIIGSMVESISRVGDIASAIDGDGWRLKHVKICAGVDADVLTPRVPVVEMDGMELFDRLYRSASDVAAHVMREFVGPSGFQQERFDAWVGDCGSGHPSRDVVLRSMEMLMDAQGWKFVSGRWRSPAWLYPPMMLERSVLVAHIVDELDASNLIEHAQDYESDQVLSVAEEL